MIFSLFHAVNLKSRSSKSKGNQTGKEAKTDEIAIRSPAPTRVVWALWRPSSSLCHRSNIFDISSLQEIARGCYLQGTHSPQIVLYLLLPTFTIPLHWQFSRFPRGTIHFRTVVSENSHENPPFEDIDGFASSRVYKYQKRVSTGVFLSRVIIVR